MNDSDQELQQLFRQYGEACPDRDAGPHFMPQLWNKIEARKGFLFSFEHVARIFAVASALLCLMLLLLDYGWGGRARFAGYSYPDALAANHSPEQTLFAESIRGVSSAEDGTGQ